MGGLLVEMGCGWGEKVPSVFVRGFVVLVRSDPECALSGGSVGPIQGLDLRR